ncbi:flavodoxins [Roseburia sp. CAG:380]|jgi:flavodoxin|nr:flavodoxins [Roseburia sp. CAG:380]
MGTKNRKWFRLVAFVLTAVLLTASIGENVSAASGKKTVVLYFSATGTTKSVAAKIKKASKGTLIEIKAADPYTDADLNYGNSNSRVTREHESAASPAESSVRPKIANESQIKKAVKKADIVYIGYPIWWGEAPHIIYTLVENTNLKGKTVVPFCTSLSSGIGQSGTHLKEKAVISSKTKWTPGRNFYGRSTQKTVNKWVKTIK